MTWTPDDIADELSERQRIRHDLAVWHFEKKLTEALEAKRHQLALDDLEASKDYADKGREPIDGGPF